MIVCESKIAWFNDLSKDKQIFSYRRDTRKVTDDQYKMFKKFMLNRILFTIFYWYIILK